MTNVNPHKLVIRQQQIRQWCPIANRRTSVLPGGVWPQTPLLELHILVTMGATPGKLQLPAHFQGRLAKILVKVDARLDFRGSVRPASAQRGGGVGGGGGETGAGKGGAPRQAATWLSQRQARRHIRSTSPAPAVPVHKWAACQHHLLLPRRREEADRDLTNVTRVLEPVLELHIQFPRVLPGLCLLQGVHGWVNESPGAPVGGGQANHRLPLKSTHSSGHVRQAISSGGCRLSKPDGGSRSLPAPWPPAPELPCDAHTRSGAPSRAAPPARRPACRPPAAAAPCERIPKNGLAPALHACRGTAR